MFHPTRGGTRGGRGEFTWDQVAADKDRENYLGHSINAPVGRWQKNKDVTWYNKDKGGDEKAAQEARDEELRKIKQAEEDALAAALGYKPISRPQPTDDASGAKAAEDDTAESKEERRRRKEERRKEKEEQRRIKEERRRERDERKAERKERRAREGSSSHSHRREHGRGDDKERERKLYGRGEWERDEDRRRSPRRGRPTDSYDYDWRSRSRSFSRDSYNASSRRYIKHGDRYTRSRTRSRSPPSSRQTRDRRREDGSQTDGLRRSRDHYDRRNRDRDHNRDRDLWDRGGRGYVRDTRDARDATPPWSGRRGSNAGRSPRSNGDGYAARSAQGATLVEENGLVSGSTQTPAEGQGQRKHARPKAWERSVSPPVRRERAVAERPA